MELFQDLVCSEGLGKMSTIYILWELRWERRVCHIQLNILRWPPDRQQLWILSPLSWSPSRAISVSFEPCSLCLTIPTGNQMILAIFQARRKLQEFYSNRLLLQTSWSSTHRHIYVALELDSVGLVLNYCLIHTRHATMTTNYWHRKITHNSSVCRKK